MSTGGIAITAVFGLLGLFPLGRVIYVLRTKMGHKAERIVRNLGLVLMSAFLAETLGMLFWAAGHNLVQQNGHYHYDVPAGTRDLLSNISWILAAGWVILLGVAWIMKRRRLRTANLEYFRTDSAIRAEYGPEEAGRIDQRTGLTDRWLRGLRDDL